MALQYIREIFGFFTNRIIGRVFTTKLWYVPVRFTAIRVDSRPSSLSKHAMPCTRTADTVRYDEKGAITLRREGLGKEGKWKK